jgi:hypothetical protein
LLSEFAGKVDLIYIDPPSNAGADFSYVSEIPESDENFLKEPTLLEQKAYTGYLGKGVDSYLRWFGQSQYVVQ